MKSRSQYILLMKHDKLYDVLCGSNIQHTPIHIYSLVYIISCLHFLETSMFALKAKFQLRIEESLGPISQSNNVHRKTNFQYHHSDLYCDITLYLATTIDLQLRSILDLCEIGPRSVKCSSHLELTIWPWDDPSVKEVKK